MHKRKTSIVIASVLALSLLIAPTQIEAAKKYTIVQEETNRSYVPIRYVGETFGYNVEWNPTTKKVKIAQESNYLELTLGSNKAIVNEVEKTLDAAPLNIAGSLYVPLRFVAEQFGTNVNAFSNQIGLKNEKVETFIESVSLKRFQKAISLPVTTTSTKVSTSGKSISLNLVYIDLYSPTLDIDAYYANNKIGSVEPFKQMVNNSKAKIAVNGTFFNAYSDTDVKVPYGYIIKDGVSVHKAPGEKRAVFVYTKDAEAKVVDVDEFLILYNNNEVETAIQAGPMLVKGGVVVADPVTEGFKDPKILTSRGTRSFIGLTNDNNLVVGTTNTASIPELAEAMLKLNIVEAMNLDGGASSALYANGKYITQAGRELSNILTIYY